MCEIYVCVNIGEFAYYDTFMQRSLTFTFCSKLAALQHNTEYGSSHWSKKLIQRQIDAFVRSSLKTQMDILFQTRILIRVLNKFFLSFLQRNIIRNDAASTYFSHQTWRPIRWKHLFEPMKALAESMSMRWWALLYTHDFFASSESSDCWSAANANYYIFKSRPKSVQKEHFHLMGRKYSL